MSERRIGVYVCNCGGNISDYVDVEQVVDAVKDEPGVVVARRAMFTCSDSTQQEIIDDIQGQELDGLVVASCSPKLHTFTFRAVAQRAGLNPYEYTQVNVREQCSWTHTDDREGATRKAISLVRAGIAHTRLSKPLDPVVVETTPRALVIGGGIAGMRAAIGLADVGLAVFLVEREEKLGGRVGDLGELFPHGKDGRALIAQLAEEIRQRPEITVFTNAELTAKSGTFGNYRAVVHAGGESIHLEVGQIIVATGFDSYQPEAGELGYGIDGVLTLPEWKQLLDRGEGAADRQRQAGRERRLRLLRRQPQRRALLLLAVLLQRCRARISDCGRPRRERPPVPPLSRSAHLRPERADAERVAAARFAVPEVRRRRSARGGARPTTASA